VGHPGGRVGQINRRIVETAADAFLNWVRGSFQDDDDGAAWEQFFDTYIGVFLRNAAIYNYPGGMVQFYIDRGVIPALPITFTKSLVLEDGTRVRLSRNTSVNNILYTTNRPGDLMPDSIQTHGIVVDGSLYWLYIAEGSPQYSGRLVWSINTIASDTPSLSDVTQLYAAYFLEESGVINPQQQFEADHLIIITGI